MLLQCSSLDVQLVFRLTQGLDELWAFHQRQGLDVLLVFRLKQDLVELWVFHLRQGLGVLWGFRRRQGLEQLLADLVWLLLVVGDLRKIK